MQQFHDTFYKAASYERISQEDGDISFSGKNESNSITSQREIIQSYARKHPEIELVKEFCDDGYTGANFDRPGFQQMMNAVRKKHINCIIVKDLSRFGREYIEAGNYLQKIFPSLGVRFIAINDNYDSADTDNHANDFVLPFKNLINDSYCRDISIKSRTSLEAKRQHGEFVGNFSVYGYIRSPEDKHKLIIDKDAAAVVRSIFNWKQDGWNAQQIAEHLNRLRVLSPMEHKRKAGQNYRSSFKANTVAQWSACAVLRILKNAVYTGVLEQGKTTTPNYKVKTRINKDKSKWARTENAHEAIVSRPQFDLVQTLLCKDTCRAKGSETIYPLSGMIFCADCNSPMIHRTATRGGKAYHYYICAGNKHDKNSCTPHSVKCESVESAVLATIQAHISTALDIDAALRDADLLDWESREIAKINGQIAALEADVDKYNSIKMDLYDDLKCGIISKEEYRTFKEEYDARIGESKQKVSELVGQRNAVERGLTGTQSWFSQFRQYENVSALSRNVIVSLIERIEISNQKDIHVAFRHADQFETALDYLRTPRLMTLQEKEVGSNVKNIPQAAKSADASLNI